METKMKCKNLHQAIGGWVEIVSKSTPVAI